MSHYPSTAELASFRRSLRPSWYDRDYTGQDLTGKAWPLAPLDYPPNRVALTYGIGDAARGPEGHLTVKARKGANRMRHDFYWLNLCIVCKVWNGPEGCDCYGPAS